MRQTRQASTKRVPWIGFVHIKPVTVDSPIGRATGGFAVALALAVSSDDYASLVSQFMTDNGMLVVNIEDVEPFADRLRTGSPDPQLVKDAQTISVEMPVSVGIIDSYTEEPD